MTTRLLFVDDEPYLRDGIRRLLARRRPDWGLAFAESGASALQLLETASFDIVVADMRMPGMDGIGLLERVRALDPGVVRAMLSGQSDRAAALRAMAVAHQFLVKPFDASHLEATLDRLCGMRKIMVDSNLQSLIGGVNSLPNAPKPFTEIVELLAVGGTSLNGVAGIITQNAALCAEVLQTAETLLPGPIDDPISIEEAVHRLGLNVVKSVAFMAGAYETFGVEDVMPAFNAKSVRRHSLTVACAAASILQGNSEADDAFMAGMLHDVGELIAAARIPEVMRRLIAQASDKRKAIHELERDELGTTHAEIGGYVLGAWGLPRTVVEAVAYHHAPSGLVSPKLDAATAVHIAEVLVSELEQGSEARCPVTVDREYLELAGLVERLDEWRASLRTLLQGRLV